MPIITLTQINDVKLGKHPAKEVVGNKVEDNRPWKKAFFANNKELRDKLADFDVGDIVNVVMEQKGEYLNIVDFKEVSDDEIEKTTQAPKAAPAEQRGGYVRTTPTGGTRGDDTNRSAAIYLAQEVVAMQQPDWEPEELAVYMVKIANEIIYPYIKDGKIVELPAKAKKGKAKADPLAPPPIEE